VFCTRSETLVHTVGNGLMSASGLVNGIRLCMAAAVTLLLTACASTSLVCLLELSVSVGRPFVIETSGKFVGWGNCSHPSLYELPGKVILVSYNAGGDSEAGYARVALSTDLGQTWTSGVVQSWTDVGLSNGECFIERRLSSTGQFNFHGAAFVALPDGRVMAQHYLVPSPLAGQSNRVGSATWSRDGITWVGPVRTVCSVPDTNAAFAFSTYAIRWTNNALLAVAHTRFAHDDRDRTIFLRSDDDGRSWNFVSTVANPMDASWGGEGANEPALAALPTGELLCVMRTGGLAYGGRAAHSDLMLMARSKDGGKTWEHRKMPIPGVMPKLLMMSNGILVCAFGRPGNNLTFSLDGGHTWGREVALTAADAQTTGYIGIAEVSPGRLLAVYDLYNSSLSGFWLWEPKLLNGVFGVFVDVDRRW
jgi:hypothetical protein